MYVLDVAAIGGESLLASSGQIYNEIAASRPDIIHVLADDQWIFDEFVRPPTHTYTPQHPSKPFFILFFITIQFLEGHN